MSDNELENTADSSDTDKRQTEPHIVDIVDVNDSDTGPSLTSNDSDLTDTFTDSDSLEEELNDPEIDNNVGDIDVDSGRKEYKMCIVLLLILTIIIAIVVSFRISTETSPVETLAPNSVDKSLDLDQVTTSTALDTTTFLTYSDSTSSTTTTTTATTTSTTITTTTTTTTTTSSTASFQGWTNSPYTKNGSCQVAPGNLVLRLHNLMSLNYEIIFVSLLKVYGLKILVVRVPFHLSTKASSFSIALALIVITIGVPSKQTQLDIMTSTLKRFYAITKAALRSMFPTNVDPDT